VKASAADIARALDAPTPATRLFLLYGADEAGSAALARRLERAMGADAERIDLDSTTLKTDPARLADEAASIALFGGGRWIRIQPADDVIVPAVQTLLDAPAAGNPVVAIAGALRATSVLVKLALAHPAVLAHASYELRPHEAEALASSLGRELGLRIGGDVAAQIATSASNDRAVMTQEIEKLALYLDAAPDRPVEASIDAVVAIAAATGDGELSRLVDAVLDGRPETVAGELARLSQEGIEGITLLRAMARRVHVLAGLRAEVDGGQRPDAVVEARGKAIFWKEKAPITRQLSRWPSPQLARAVERLIAAEQAIKGTASAGAIVADTELIAMSRAAQRLR
jgi:DNA polymerase-3 subunit delta